MKLDVLLEKYKDRMHIFDRRYKKNGDEYADMFLRSLMMLLSEDGSSGFPFPRLKRRRIVGYLEVLGLCDKDGIKQELSSDMLEELDDLSLTYITSCLSSKTYGSTFFGMIPMQDEGVARRIAQDINIITLRVPRMFDLTDVAEPLRKSMINTYKSRVENGADLWEKFKDVED